MSQSRVFARKYRPQRFSEVLGQDAVIKTLKNAIRYERLAHAYLFSGPRGVGKTTIARLLAKALNCTALSEEQEPCNACAACREIAAGTSVEVLEIDGASNRGIEEVRRLNEIVSYGSKKGSYRVILIDEVHMLTKEAFNALLKTLEEPPPRVIFFFATTELNKVLPTILSRCQCFQLRRIEPETVASKLTAIAADTGIEISPEALQLVAQRAGGGLRDAESMLDQLYAFCGEKISTEDVCAAFGWVTPALYGEFERSAEAGDYRFAFDVVEKLYSEGKDLSVFLEGLADHYRSRTLEVLKEKQQDKCELYMNLLAATLRLIERFAHAPSQRCMLESFLLEQMRRYSRPPVEALMGKLEELERALQSGKPSTSASSTAPPPSPPKSVPPRTALPPPPAPPPVRSQSEPEAPPAENRDYSETLRKQSRYDTLMQFAAVELRGALTK